MYNTLVFEIGQSCITDWRESMEIGVGLDQGLGLSFPEQREMVREAVQLGYTSAWTPAGLARDAFQICAQWSTQTRDIVPEGIQTGISVVPVATWSVPTLAATAATVGDLTHGRFVLGIGAGSAYMDVAQRTFGQPAYRPIILMREHLIALQGLLRGEQIDIDGTAVKLRAVQLAFRPPRVPVYFGALGPKMLELAGELAAGVALNWCTPEQIAWSRSQIAHGAQKAGRDTAELTVVEYIRMCVDEDLDTARRALAKAVMGYALARPGQSKALGYRAHFARMGFDEALTDLEARRDRGASQAELIDAFPRELLLKVGYFGPASVAAAAFRNLARGLDVAIVRVVAARPGLESISAVMQACRPSSVLVP
jgi:alkanesulfonate monooxygenase SsuD/methylene tetrahydromethanopterin reductase-like flavin-dependent oxidoreductase (luciferase family)